MEANEKILNTFVTRVRQLILQYQDLKQENDSLRAQIGERDATIRELQGQMAKLQDDYDTLKTARMLQVGDRDLEKAKKRIASLVRDVDKCITLLSSE